MGRGRGDAGGIGGPAEPSRLRGLLPLSVRNGAVFCMDPTTGSTNDPTVIAQISVATGSTWRATVNARGKRSGYAGGGGDDWEAVGLTFRGGGGH